MMYEDVDIGHDLKMAFEDGYQAGVEAAQPKWISVEERLPEESGYYLAYDCRGNLFVCLYQANRLWDSSSVDYWMPIPEPPKPPKKVKTYKDVFLEKFPKAKTMKGFPQLCRHNVYGGKEKCLWDSCEECWNQPYPEEEGVEE